MTKKEFKEQCSFHEYGRGKNKRNAIYFGYKCNLDNDAVGYKYMVKCSVVDSTKAELFGILYDWINEKIQQVPYWVQYKFAITDQDRFKVKLMG